VSQSCSTARASTLLVVLVGDGRRWLIPSDNVDGVSALRLGGPKCAEFEVDRGNPIPACTPEETPSRIAC
jgi:hypothetical protein